MEARAGTARPTTQERQVTTAPRQGRIRALLSRSEPEDGVFRPVRLPLWIDATAAVAIVAFVAASWVGFFWWLARTQGQ